MGLPSIVTNINGSSEIIEEGVNGYIIPSHSPVALLQAMERMTDPRLRRALAEQARPLVAQRYERKALWKALLQYYQSR